MIFFASVLICLFVAFQPTWMGVVTGEAGVAGAGEKS